MNSALPNACLQWDIFCRVIDNFGDIGVCWRLAVNLAQRGQGVRLWVDDASALTWMAPQGAPGVQVLPWRSPLNLAGIRPGEVLVEAFGCDADPDFVAAYAGQIRAGGQKCIWINLEYLSAEPYVQRCHGLPSPVMSGPGRGLVKHFFYPGFTANTGGLLREPDLCQRQTHFDRHAWLAQLRPATAAAIQTESPPAIAAGSTQSAPVDSCHDLTRHRLVALFCYEPAGLPALLDALASDAQPTLLLVTAGRAAAAVRQMVISKISLQPRWNKRGQLSFFYLPRVTQRQFDELLWACDLNFVRGEDSLVRALWAGKPLVWQAYPQHDGAHHAKLDAFLDWLQAPPDLRQLHALWNAASHASAAGRSGHALANVQLPDTLIAWQQTLTQARQNLLAQNDLASALISFALKNH